jgi:hypothetical protein
MTPSTVPNTTTTSQPTTVALTWDQVAVGDDPVTPAEQLFYTVVLATAAQAKASMPDANGRLERARDLVLGGLVQPGPDNTFTVRSASARGKSYTLTEGVCTCHDAEKREDHRCQHLLAAWIWRKARQTLAAQLARNGHQPAEAPAAPIAQSTLDGSTPAAEASTTPVPAPALPPLPEAPASVNIEVKVHGRWIRLTLRDHDENHLLARLDALMQRFPVEAEPPQAPQTPAAADTPTTPEGWCATHGVQMRLNRNDKGAWWSHRLADGTWCRG